MAGIDKIIGQIEQDTLQVCSSIMNEAQRKADAIVADAQARADEITAQGREKTVAHVADIKKRGDSAAELEEKRVLLFAKQHIISVMLNKALEEQKNLPEDEYFALITEMVAKYSQPESGKIVFSARDKARMPADLLQKLNAVSKGTLALSGEDAAIEAGFILQYGGIEQNCSFDAIFASEAETLSDRAGKLLFG